MIGLGGRAVAVGVLVVIGVFASGCPQSTQLPARPAPTPPTSIPAPRIEARAHPIFRLVIPPRPLDEPARLVAVFVRIENIDDRVLLVRPDRIRLELGNGSRCSALDKPRALEILKHALLTRYDHFGRDRDERPPAESLSRGEHHQWNQRFHADLLDDTRLAPGEAVEGFVIVDTGGRFTSLRDTIVEAVAEAPDLPAGEAERYPVRVLLGSPIEIRP